MKPYTKIPIQDCGEALVAIPLEQFSVVTPHPYEVLGAPYGDRSPYYLREAVLHSLCQAQTILQQTYPDWQIQIFDAYRPIPVQQFMVDHAYGQLLDAKALNPQTLSTDQEHALRQEVYQFWAVPSPDPSTPPPHSTGAAIDITLVNESQEPIEMGSPIDEISDRSYPNYFATQPNPTAQTYHHHRQILYNSMAQAGFTQHPNEWWHFSKGDQLWAWLRQQDEPNKKWVAHYGRVSGE